MDFSLAGLTQAAGAHEDMITSTLNSLSALTQQGEDAGNALVAAVQSGTDAKGDTALSLQTRKLGELEAQSKNAEFYASLGMDREGQAKISNALGSAFQDNVMQALEQSKSIQEREAVGLLDNPAAYLWNQLILPDEKNALEATLKRGDVIKGSLNELNKALSDTAQNEATYSQKITAASVDSQVQGLKANVDADAARARMQAIQLNSHDLTTVLAADKGKLETISQVVAARNSAEHLAMAREAASREKVKFDQWQVDQKDTEDYITEMTALANDTASRLGKPEIPRKEVALALKGKAQPGLQQMVQSYAQNGFINKNSGALGTAYGETASAALDFSVKTNTPLPPAISDIYSEASAKLKQQAELGKIDLKNKSVADSAFNNIVEDNLKLQMKKVDHRDGTNPYNIPDMKVTSLSTAVKASQLYKTAFATEVAAGGLVNSDPDVVYAKGMQAVKEGKITMGQLAQDIVTFYRAGVEANNAEKQFARYGMPEQTSYNTPVKAAKVLWEKDTQKPVNQLDLVEVNAALVRMAAKTRTSPFGYEWRN